jgi:hypothetical protein
LEQLEKSKQNRVNPVNRVIRGTGSLAPRSLRFVGTVKRNPARRQQPDAGLVSLLKG